MRLQHLVASLLLVSSTALAQPSSNATSANDSIMAIGSSTDATKTNTLTYECNSWIATLYASDLDSSNGLSEAEYHTFLSNIEDPPHLAEYFRGIPSFNQLAWVFRAVHKSLACRCQNFGMGEGCCTGDDAEILLNGLGRGNDTTTTVEKVDEEYVDFVCQQIAYVLSASISGHTPTPTARPSVSASIPHSLGSVTSSPIIGASDPLSFSLKPTVYAPVEVVTDVIVVEGASEQEQTNGIGTGGIVGINIAVFLAIISVIALVSYRHKLERSRLRKQAVDNLLEEDIEATPQVANKSPGLISVREIHSADEGFETQVLPESNPAADEILALISLVETNTTHGPSHFESALPYIESESDPDSHAPSYIESVSSYLGSEADPSSHSAPSYLESTSSYLESEPDPESEEDESCASSSVWSGSDAGDTASTNYYRKGTDGTALAALGVASTVTAKLMAPSTPNEKR